MRGDPRAPFGGVIAAVVVVLALVALLSVFRLSGIETDIRALDTAIAVLLRTIGLDVA